MSLEYYTCTGNVLPIGLAVCSFCREKHLKSVDLSNSKIITIANPVTLQNGPGLVNLKGIYKYIRSPLNQSLPFWFANKKSCSYYENLVILSQ